MVVKGHWTVTGACGPYNLGGSATSVVGHPICRAFPTEERPQRMSAKPTMLGTLQFPSSFGSSGPFSAKAACTISSMLDDLQLDIMLQIHERTCEFSLPGITLSHLGTAAMHERIQWKGRRRGSGPRTGERMG